MNLALSKQNFFNNFVINQFCYCISAPRTDWNWAKHSDRRVDKFIKIGLEEMLEEIEDWSRESKWSKSHDWFWKKKYANLKKYRQLFVEEVKKNFARENWKIFIPKRNRCNGIRAINPYIHHPFICNPDYVTPPHVDLFNLIPRNPPSPFIMSYVILYTTSPVIPPILRLYFPSLKAFARSLPGHRYR